MSAIRSLSSGISGMLSNQLAMDVTANNLANVNTPGFKGSRVSFANSLLQTVYAGSAPGNNVGGLDPRQVGLGVQATSIDRDMRQGALTATGRGLDLAVQGEGFFEVSDGTRSAYTRVGAFGLDANNNLVHLGSGYRAIGNIYSLDLQPDGTQAITQSAVPLNLPVDTPFPPQRTETVDFQGNLSSDDPALRGSQLQAVYAVRDLVTGQPATGETELRNLDLFHGGAEPADPAARNRTIYVLGTKPDGEAYGGSFTIDAWNDTLSTMVQRLNDCLAQGSQRFGSVELRDGMITATSQGAGGAFSLFLGEENPFPTAGPAIPALGSGSAAYHGAAIDPAATHTFAAPDEAGLLRMTFTLPARDYSAQGNANLAVTIRNGDTVIGSLSIPANYYTGAGSNVFTIPSFSHVALDDTVTYSLSGGLNLADSDGDGVDDISDGTDIVQWSANLASDASASNLTQDLDGDQQPDMFEEDTTADINAWVYRNGTNATFDWYRARFVPDSVPSSIQVYDAQGGRHMLETRFFRTGTRTDPGNGARINSWDMIANIPASQGDLISDLIAGIEFDQQGRPTGAVGTTAHGTALDANQYVGDPAASSVQVDWDATGPTDPATIRFNLGLPQDLDGLTGFGSDSTASAVDQDGYPDGVLDSLTVSSEGDIIALYTNGESRRLAQLALTTFRNPAGLEAVEGNLYHQASNSGDPVRRVAGQGAGLVSAGTLESSNVDIATEFSNLITAQRGYQVSARVIQASDRMLEEVANLVR